MCKNIVLTAVVLALVCVTSTVLATVDSNDANQAIKQKPAAAATTGQPGLVGWWKLDEKEGNSVKDSSGNNFSATVHLNGGPLIWAPGQGIDSGGCAKFTGQQTIVIPNMVWSKVKQQLSIALWVNQDASKPPGETWPGPFGCAPVEGLKFPDPNWLPLRAFMPTPNKTIDIGKDSEHVYWEPGDANAYAGSWNHYVFIKDTNEHVLKLYHNGVQVASSFDAMEQMPKLNNFILGGRMYPNGDWSGMVDDFRIYNTALSQDEVQKLFEKK